MAERYDNDLHERLNSLKQTLDRQILILDWCFHNYRLIAKANIFKYEDIIITGGRELSKLFPSANNLALDLSTRNQNKVYPFQLSARLAESLLRQGSAWREFYSEEEILSLTNSADIDSTNEAIRMHTESD